MPDHGSSGGGSRPYPSITSIGVGGYKSIKDLQPFAIRPVNILIGANGAGKTNLISFFRLLKSVSEQKLQLFVGRAGGADQLLHYGSKQTSTIWVALEFSTKTGPSSFYFQLVLTDTNGFAFSTESLRYRVTSDNGLKDYPFGAGHLESKATGGSETFDELVAALRGIETYHFEDTSVTSGVRRGCYIEDNRSLRSDAANLAALLYRLKQRQEPYYRRIVESIRQVAPFFDDFVLEPSELEPNSILLNWRDRFSNHLFGPHQLSDGSIRSMALITLLAQPPGDLPGLIVLDEPEIGLHPYAIEILAGLIKGASVHRPVIVATQSTSLVNHFAPDDVVTVTREGSQSKFTRQEAAALKAWLDEYRMGEIWEHNLIGGNPV